jgi:hypothetical protein
VNPILLLARSFAYLYSLLNDVHMYIVGVAVSLCVSLVSSPQHSHTSFEDFSKSPLSVIQPQSPSLFFPSIGVPRSGYDTYLHTQTREHEIEEYLVDATCSRRRSSGTGRMTWREILESIV